jgi:RNA polymerase-binding transcription factor DksA
MAAYTQELNKQQQAVQQYQSDMAAMEQRRAQLKAAAEEAQAAWERAVAACKAGDYSQCGH